MSLATMLRNRMQVLKTTVSRQHGGASDFKWDGEGQSYACNVQPLSSSKKLNLLAMNIEATHNLYFDPKQVTLANDDRVSINGKGFKVASLESPIDQPPGWPAEAFIVEAKL